MCMGQNAVRNLERIKPCVSSVHVLFSCLKREITSEHNAFWVVMRFLAVWESFLSESDNLAQLTVKSRLNFYFPNIDSQQFFTFDCCSLLTFG